MEPLDGTSRETGGALLSGGGRGVVILIPVYNDWESLRLLLPAIDSVLVSAGETARVLVVDDGSIASPPEAGPGGPFLAVERVEILELRRNLGHQRAIAIGLAFLEDQVRPEAVVVMDGDGEDDPADIPRLLDRLRTEGGRKIVFAERARRSENWTFRLFYALYKGAHTLLTGQTVRFGNFSAIPSSRLGSLVGVTELWNHYAAAAVQSRQPYCMIPTRRAIRLRGRSSMNFVGLVAHGLSAISVYNGVVGVRLLVLSVLLAILGILGVMTTVFIRLATNWAIPGWATAAISLFLTLFIQALMLAMVFVFVILGGRNNLTFLPLRDYKFFMRDVAWWRGPGDPSLDGSRDTARGVESSR